MKQRFKRILLSLVLWFYGAFFFWYSTSQPLMFLKQISGICI